MHVKAKTVALGGLMLALSVVFMSLGSILETSTLFLLAAASYFVGLTVREFGLKTGAAFYIAAVLLGFITAPNKFYVITFSAMGLYIWGIEAVWRWLERSPGIRNRHAVFLISKYVLFNLIYLPSVLIFRNLLFGRELSKLFIFGIIIAGQIGILIYDKAYDYVQMHIWGKIRGRLLQ